MNNENKFKNAYSKALEYARVNWSEYEDGFSEIIELDDSWFFGRNESKNKQLIIDNTLGIIISKKDLSLNLCFGGTKEHFSLEKGKVLEISNDYLKQNAEEFLNNITDEYKPKSLAEEE